MHRIRKAAIAAVWFMLLTLPVLGIKLNTVDRTVSWRFDRILILGVAIFGLALIWDWCFTRKARGLPLLSLPHTGGLPARLALLRERPRVLAAALGALCSYASALVVPLAVLIAVMLADYASGMAKAWSAGKLCSKTGLRGILKKLGYLVLVGVAGVVDWLVRYGLTQVGVEVSFQFLMAAMVIVWLIINELISILENVAALGGPVPGFLRKLLTRLKATVETKAGEGDQNADQ